jgi:hypothetical protein
MSKMYQMNRMRYSAAAGGIFALPILAKVGKFIAKAVKGKAASAVVATAKKVAASPAVRAGAAGAAGAIGVDLLSGAGGGSGGASGSWSRRRRKGITGAELRGFHKVARLLHKEGMVVKHARRGK